MTVETIKEKKATLETELAKQIKLFCDNNSLEFGYITAQQNEKGFISVNIKVMI